MKNFQQNLLITLALALCGLCAGQWYFQTVQRARLADQNQAIFQRDTAIQGYTNSLDKMNQQIMRMDQNIAGLSDNLQQAVQTNRELIILQKREIARLGAMTNTLFNDITQYTNNLATLQNNLDNAYAGIKKQNAMVEQLVTNRDFFIQKYTNTVILYNDLVDKYTNVVDRLNKLQATASNAPAK